MYQYNKLIQKMINFDAVVKENIKEHNQNWSQFADHPYRILIIGDYRSEKTNSLFNLTDVSVHRSKKCRNFCKGNKIHNAQGKVLYLATK